MTNNKEENNNFLVQGSILAFASILSRVIGLIYRVPLTRIIGPVGNNYYACAYEIYNIMLIISSYSIPLAVSKVVAMHASKKEFKNTMRVLKGALVFAFITGSGAACACFFGGEYFTSELLVTPLSIIALRVLVPTLVCVALLGVFRGFFQGFGTNIPSAISQIIEQIVNAIISVWAAYVLFNYGGIVGAVLADEEHYAAAFGAAGGTLGTTAGSFVALIFIVLLFTVYKKGVLRKKLARDRTIRETSYGEIFKILILTIIPVLLSTTIYNISSIIDQGVFKNMIIAKGALETDVENWWGVFAGEYKVLINVPISIASAMAASCVPSLTAAFNNDDHREVRRQIKTSSHFIMMIAFPCAVGLFAFARPIMELLFKDTTDLAANLLKVGAISVIFYSLSTLSNGLLQGIDRLKVPVINAAVALVVHLAFLGILIKVTDLNIYTVVLANAFYALVMCVLNQKALRKYAGANINTAHSFIKPFIASVVMGGAAYGVYRLFYLVTHLLIFALILGIFIAIIVYFVALLLIGGVTKEELYGFPKGYILVEIAERLHLIDE